MPYGARTSFRKFLDGLHRLVTQQRQSKVARLGAVVGFALWMTLSVFANEMSSGHRCSAIVRLWIWQLWRRILNLPVVVTFACGAKLYCPAWSNIAGAWVSIGYHEEELLFVLDFIRPGEGMIDVGANIGAYAMVALSAGARVLAFEPVKEARLVLVRNAAINHATERLVVKSAALADFDGYARMTSELENANHLLADEQSGGTQVLVKRLDAVLAEGSFGAIATLLKVDAEGFDEAVLSGASAFLRGAHPAVIVEVWAGGNRIRYLLESLDYQIFHYNSKERHLEVIPANFEGDGYFIGVHRAELERTRERLSRTAGQHRQLAPTVRWFGANKLSV